MDREQYQRIRRAVLGAEGLVGAERAAFLDDACGGDATVQDAVARLLGEESVATRDIAVAGSPSLHPTSAEAFADPPQRVGPYEVGERIGAGGMGVVFAATDTRDGSEVALKFLHSHLLSDPRMRERFRREALAGARIVHPAVVRTLDLIVRDEEGLPRDVLVMERVRGRSLRQILADWGRVPEGLLREIAVQVARALAAVHAAGIVHRDVKPENVLLTDDQRVRLMDLGIARIAEATHALTVEGQFVGTFAYAAPEQFESPVVGPESDLYSLGVVLYELATGSNPFVRGGLAAAMRAHLGRRPPPASERAPDLSPFLVGVIASLLEVEPTRRLGPATRLETILTQGDTGAWWTGRRGLDGPGAPDTGVRREAAVHGRGSELAWLRSGWEDAAAGRGRTLYLTGEAGIGKTRLLDAFLREAAIAGARVLYGAFPPEGGMGGLTGALRRALGEDRLDERLTDLLEEAADSAAGQAALLTGQPGAEPEAALSTLCCRLGPALAAERPTLWVVDDLHFAPVEARRAAFAVARSVEGIPLLLVLASRSPPTPEEAEGCRRLATFEHRALGRLSPREVQELLEDVLRSEALADRLGAVVARKTDGVPFFVLETVRALVDAGTLERDGEGGYHLVGSATDLEVPSAVRDLVVARVRDLRREERECLDVAAVLGAEFDAGLVAAVLGRPRVRVLQDLAELERRHGAVRSAGARHRFDHHQFQEVLLQELPAALRAEYHTLAADALATELGERAAVGEVAYALARHHLAGVRCAAALPHLDAALAHLAASHRGEEAAALIASALARPRLVEGSARVELLLSRSRFADGLGRRDEQLAAASEALEVAERLTDPVLLARANLALGVHAYEVFDGREARVRSRAAREHAEGSGHEDLAVEALRAEGASLLRDGRTEEARERIEEAVRRSAAAKDAKGEALSLVILGGLLTQTFRYEEARVHAERARDLLEAEGRFGAAARAHSLYGTCCWALGRLDDARRAYQRSLALAERVGDRATVGGSRGRLGLLSLHAGRLDEARRQLRHQHDVGLELDSPVAVGQALTNLAQVEGLLGEFAHAAELAQRAAHVSEHIAAFSMAASCYSTLSFVRRSAGDLDGARDAAHRAMEHACAAKDKVHQAVAHMELGVAALDAGDRDEAAKRLGAAKELAVEVDEPQILVFIELHLAVVGLTDPGQAASYFREHGARLGRGQRILAAAIAFEVTADRQWLRQAHEDLEFLRDHAPAGSRRTLLEEVPAHRRVREAWTC